MQRFVLLGAWAVLRVQYFGQILVGKMDMNYSGNIFLVGPMGVGKTTVGRALAEHLGIDFYDSDQEIEVSTGADIPWIFDVEGESGFRSREIRMIDQLSKKKNIVLATGGGVVLSLSLIHI